MFIFRTFSSELIDLITKPYQDKMKGFIPSSWLENKNNIALTDGTNLALFEKSSDDIYTGHYFFKVRGREALQIADQMLEFFFENTNINIIRGLTPLTKLGARWLSRQLGFKGMGVIDADTNDPCELFILTRDSWNERKN